MLWFAKAFYLHKDLVALPGLFLTPSELDTERRRSDVCFSRRYLHLCKFNA